LAIFITHIGNEPNSYRDCHDWEFDRFLAAYVNVRKWEGNYSNLKDDKGGETYGGISRTYNGDWRGWELVDDLKNDTTIHWNHYIPDVEKLVIDYYFTKWVEEGFYKINDPFIANYVFDYNNTGVVAMRHVQQVLRHHNYDVDMTLRLDDKTIRALNTINPLIFVLHLKEVRKEYYERVADRNPELEKFLKGWIKRANNINIDRLVEIS